MVSGTWTLHFSWGCTSSYGQASIVFNGDGSFGGTHTGQWRQREGTLLLTFQSGPAKYAGTVNGAVGSGAMSTFSGLDGCWYLTRQGISGVAEEVSSAGQEADPSGSPVAGSSKEQAGQDALDAAGNPR